MTLSNDTCRCAGRFGLGPDDPVCERREACARYVEFRDHWPNNDPIRYVIPVSTGLCRDGDDYLIPLEAA